MKRALALSLVLVMSTPALAQGNSYRFEITPYAAYRVGGQFEEENGGGEFELKESDAVGIIVNGNMSANTQWEFLYASQNTEVNTQGLFVNDPVFDLDVEYYHLGGTYLFDGDNFRPFLAMTLGASRFSPQPAEFSSESFFSASLGGGLHFNPSKRVGIRLEGRVFTTLIDGDSAIFCGTGNIGGACLIQVDGTLLTQWEARAGLVFRF